MARDETDRWWIPEEDWDAETFTRADYDAMTDADHRDRIAQTYGTIPRRPANHDHL